MLRHGTQVADSRAAAERRRAGANAVHPAEEGYHDHRYFSSATAVAMEELAQREKVLNMVGGSGSNDTTGKDRQRYSFRSPPSAYMACKALAPVLGKKLGHNLKAAFWYPTTPMASRSMS